MEFARKELEKYGWTEGKGLGKHENGISEPIKAKKKQSHTGVGYNPAADFTEHWWSTLYDKAASNLEVKNKNGKTKKIRRKSVEEFEITNSTWKLKRKNKESTGNEEYPEFFVKTIVMGSGGEETVRVKVSDSESDDEMMKVTARMTDEELFAACQGRTAHKGARHGLRALGKLARIEKQEKVLLQQTKYKGYSHYEERNNNNNVDTQIVKDTSAGSNAELNAAVKKKKRKNPEGEKQRIDHECNDSENIYITEVIGNVQCTDNTNEDNLHLRSNYKDNSNSDITKNNKDVPMAVCSVQSNLAMNTVIEKKKKKKQGKYNNEYTGAGIIEIVDNIICDDTVEKVNNKSEIDTDDVNIHVDMLATTDIVQSKKQKRKQLKQRNSSLKHFS